MSLVERIRVRLGGFSTRENIAKSTSDLLLLQRLAGHPSLTSSIVRNPNATVEILGQLYDECDNTAIRGLIENHARVRELKKLARESTSLDELKKLIDTPFVTVVLAARSNPVWESSQRSDQSVPLPVLRYNPDRFRRFQIRIAPAPTRNKGVKDPGTAWEAVVEYLKDFDWSDSEKQCLSEVAKDSEEMWWHKMSYEEYYSYGEIDYKPPSVDLIDNLLDIKEILDIHSVNKDKIMAELEKNNPEMHLALSNALVKIEEMGL